MERFGFVGLPNAGKSSLYNALTGGGTDLEFFSPAGTTDVYGAFGTLGQDDVGSIGQRILQLTRNGVVAPRWVADHGSAHCTIQNTSVTGLQHDSQVGVVGKIRLLTDTIEAVNSSLDLQEVLEAIAHEVAAAGARHPLDPRRLVVVHMDGHRVECEQLAHAADLVAHHVAAHVVGVVMRGERTRDLHPVAGGHVEDAADVVGGVDSHRLARVAVADQVREVDHLAR
jgi:hypothetical protein